MSTAVVIVGGMSVPATDPPKVQAPEADPVAIRACLTPEVRAVFDREWEYVLEQAKASKDLAGVRDLLVKWRIWAYSELVEPGTYLRTMEKAERILHGWRPEGSISGTAAELRELLEARRSGTDPDR